jgi:hypothetical protein
MRKPQRRDHTSLSGGLEGGDWNLYTKVGAELQNSSGGSQIPMTTTELLQHKASYRDDLLCLGFVRTQGNKILNENKGKKQTPLVEV